MNYPTNIDVFEHGIEVASGDPPSGLARLATTREPIYSGYALAVVDQDGSSLNERAVHLVDVPVAHRTSDFHHERDVVYCVFSTLYHLNRIIDLYVEKCRLFEQIASGSLEGNTSDPRIYYEVDAFFGAARRIYEAISTLLWKHYAVPRNMHGRWRSIRKAVQSEVIPAEFVGPLQQSWETRGEKLTDYRDCVIHTSPLTVDFNATCWMSRFGDRWGATIPLPANPEAKSRAAFDYSANMDALTYCHGTAAHLVRLCEQLMAVSDIASHIANPPQH